MLTDGLAPPTPSGWPARRWGGWRSRERLLATRAATTLLVVAAGVTATVVALRPPPGPSPAGPPLVGVSVVVPPPPSLGPTARPVVATYRLSAAGAAARVAVTGVTGPFVGSSEVRRASRRGGATVFTVSATPDCRSAASLDARGGRYLVVTTRTGTDGRPARARVRLPGSRVDWAAAIRAACWQQLAGHGIEVAAVRAAPDRASRRVVLAVSLHSSLPRDVQVGAIDVADVATLSAADAGILQAGSDAVLHVRWPIEDCASPALPPTAYAADEDAVDRPVATLAWSVGPAGKDPAALTVTVLSATQLATVRHAVAGVCAPPGTSVRVTAARALPPDRVVVDHAGVAIAVRLALVSSAPLVVVGQSPRGLTADARAGITQGHVHLSGHRGSTTVVWAARCALPDPAPPLLPIRIGDRGHLVGYTVTLDDPSLASTYARACGLDRQRLRAAGWSVAGPRGQPRRLPAGAQPFLDGRGDAGTDLMGGDHRVH
ncbi:MAG: hypothetical protein QOI54_862 [Actinomycetota bacterium]|jgi:hypothetical protein|nr:hypothetical protein [Actinomycetota bacterium]